MKKSGFTLVEMLIVVVIIGILASALFPKITGYMERTRDLKRQTDLHTIAAAIEIHQSIYGEYPKRKGSSADLREIYFWSVNQIELSEDIIKNLPHDPKKVMIKLHEYPYTHEERTHNRWWKNREGGFSLRPGEYLYQLFKKNGIPCGSAVLVAKTETPDASNFVFDIKKRKKYQEGGTRWTSRYTSNSGITKYTCPDMDIDQLHLCSQISKGNNIRSALIHNDPNCTYTSEDQLYYVYKIE